MNDACQIRYFSNEHIRKMTDEYHYTPNMSTPIKMPRVDTLSPFDEQQRRNVWKREEFRIISVSRFDFPHKAYIIGLIDAYEEIKKKYSNVTLMIVGYGHSLTDIKERISLLDAHSQSGITMIGETNYDDLPALYNEANLNISVAGCCCLGAKNGVLSIPARHFSYSCEVYGFLPDSINMITSAEPGCPVIPYIEETINMTEDEYVKKCYAGHHYDETFSNKSSLFDTNLKDYVLPRSDIRFILTIHCVVLLYVPFKQRLHRATHGGFLQMIKKLIYRYKE